MTAVLVVAAVLLALGLVLAIPLEVEFHLERRAATRGRVVIRWLFGAIHAEVSVPSGRRAGKREKSRARARDGEQGRRRGRGRRMLSAIRDDAFRARAWRFAQELLRAARLDDVYLHARLGLGDPADTGRLWALLGPVGAAASALPGVDVRLEPEFLDPVLEVEARGKAVVVPLEILVLVGAFLVAPVSLRTWRMLRATDA
ncbi:MAG: DUF2953 domain-containing protein [Anaeromyxobacteraceae bacterium]